MPMSVATWTGEGQERGQGLIATANSERDVRASGPADLLLCHSRAAQGEAGLGFGARRGLGLALSRSVVHPCLPHVF